MPGDGEGQRDASRLRDGRGKDDQGLRRDASGTGGAATLAPRPHRPPRPPGPGLHQRLRQSKTASAHRLPGDRAQGNGNASIRCATLQRFLVVALSTPEGFQVVFSTNARGSRGGGAVEWIMTSCRPGTILPRWR